VISLERNLASLEEFLEVAQVISSVSGLQALRNPSLPVWGRKIIFRNKYFSNFYFNRRDIKKLLEVAGMEELIKLPFSLLTIFNTPQFVKTITRQFSKKEGFGFFLNMPYGVLLPLYGIISLTYLVDADNSLRSNIPS
jgi:hypothetical protein